MFRCYAEPRGGFGSALRVSSFARACTYEHAKLTLRDLHCLATAWSASLAVLLPRWALSTAGLSLRHTKQSRTNTLSLTSSHEHQHSEQGPNHHQDQVPATFERTIARVCNDQLYRRRHYCTEHPRPSSNSWWVIKYPVILLQHEDLQSTSNSRQTYIKAT
jgi:hypothetical protein